MGWLVSGMVAAMITVMVLLRRGKGQLR